MDANARGQKCQAAEQRERQTQARERQLADERDVERLPVSVSTERDARNCKRHPLTG
jgi:hypothetical protein